ncbi:MAG: ROK family protein [bacterium]
MISAYLSVDLGGTTLRMALLDEAGNVLGQQILSSDLVREGADLIKVLSQEAELFRSRAEKIEAEILGMALGIPGLVDSERGVVLQSPHFPAWQSVALREALQKRFTFPVLMDNDANQAALGEAWQGAGAGWPSFILLTLGTGVGGGIILDGKVFHGPNGFAGEVGHIVIDRDGLTGALGSRGTLESLASQSGLQLQLRALQGAATKSSLSTEVRELDPDDSRLPERLFKLARLGNSDALFLWDALGQALGCGIASLSLAFGFQRFIIGGGLSAAWEFFKTGCQTEAQGRTYSVLAPRLEIAQAKLGNEAGLLGGARALQLAKSD